MTNPRTSGMYRALRYASYAKGELLDEAKLLEDYADTVDVAPSLAIAELKQCCRATAERLRFLASLVAPSR